MKAKPKKNMATDMYQQQNIERRLNIHIVCKKDNEFRLLKQNGILLVFPCTYFVYFWDSDISLCTLVCFHLY